MTIAEARVTGKEVVTIEQNKTEQSVMRRMLRKMAVTTVGAFTIIAGVIMLVIPGPGMLTILAGVSILGTEYPWAKRLTNFLVVQAKRVWSWLKVKIFKTAKAAG